MPSFKSRCPECDTAIKATVDDSDGATEVELTCPNRKCRHTFTTEMERPARKGTRAKRRRDEDEDDRPSRGGKKGNSRVAVAVAAGAVLLVAGVLAALTLGGSKGKDVAKTDAPKQVEKQPAPRPNPNQPPKDKPTPAPVPDPDSDAQPDPGPNAPRGVAPEEDVFATVAGFKPEGPAPEFPPLPPIERRPSMVLDPGGHTAFVRHVFFTPEATRLVTVSDDKSVRVWDNVTGDTSVIRLPAGPDVAGTPRAAALSPDGKTLAVGVFPADRGAAGFPIYLISVESGSLARTLPGSADVPEALDFSPNGAWVGVGSSKGTVQLLETAGGKEIFRSPAHRGPVRQLRLNPKRPAIATVGADKDVKVWRLTDPKKPEWSVSLTEEGPNTCEWTSDGQLLAVGCTNGEVYFYDANGKLVKTVPAIKDREAPIQVTRMKFMPDNRYLVFGGIAYLGWAGIIDTETGQRKLVRDHTNTVLAVGVSGGGKYAVSSGGEFAETLVWDTETTRVIRRFAAASRGLWAAGWAKDGRSLAWGVTNRFGQDHLAPLEHTFRLDDLGGGGPPAPGDYLRHNRDDAGLTIRIDDFYRFTVLDNGRPLYQHTSTSNRIYSVTILPGKGVVVGASMAMYLLDARTGRHLRKFHGDTGLTTALAPSPDGKMFVSGSTDQVLRVWSADRDEPLLSVFSVDREWIAWTPHGYYACSASGERLMGWQVNNGLDRLPSTHPAVRFRASMYRPNLVKYTVPSGDPLTALALASRSERFAAGLNDVLPPAVTLTAPESADGEFTATATAEGTAGNPIVAMRLLVDGRPYLGAAGVRRFTPAQEKTQATWKVALSPGKHTLTVLADSVGSKGVSAPAAVARSGKEQLPNLYVLAVGVSEYEGDARLNYAASDAHLLTSTLKEKSKGVFGTIEVRTLTDKEATRKAILEGLDWLGAKMTSRDVGIFSFSGHGARDPRTGRFFLVPVDVNEDDPVGTCVSGDEFKGRLENMSGRLVAMLDACHSGAAATRPKPTAGGRPDNLVRDLLTDDYGVVVMCSSLGREVSLESRGTKAGFFTLGLTEGLSGKADFNKDGVVYIHELDVYATMRVAQLSSGRQNPTTGRPPTIRPFPISRP